MLRRKEAFLAPSKERRAIDTYDAHDIAGAHARVQAGKPIDKGWPLRVARTGARRAANWRYQKYKRKLYRPVGAGCSLSSLGRHSRTRAS